MKWNAVLALAIRLLIPLAALHAEDTASAHDPQAELIEINAASRGDRAGLTKYSALGSCDDMNVKQSVRVGCVAIRILGDHSLHSIPRSSSGILHSRSFAGTLSGGISNVRCHGNCIRICQFSVQLPKNLPRQLKWKRICDQERGRIDRITTSIVDSAWTM